MRLRSGQKVKVQGHTVKKAVAVGSDACCFGFVLLHSGYNGIVLNVCCHCDLKTERFGIY